MSGTTSQSSKTYQSANSNSNERIDEQEVYDSHGYKIFVNYYCYYRNDSKKYKVSANVQIVDPVTAIIVATGRATDGKARVSIDYPEIVE